MPSFGTKSTQRLHEADPELQAVLNETIKHIDFSIIDAYRDQGRQNQYYNEGVSTVRWPNSKHNTYPSRAVDIVPYPGAFDASDETFYLLASYVFASANSLGVLLEWGGHWKNFKDLAHYQLKD